MTRSALLLAVATLLAAGTARPAAALSMDDPAPAAAPAAQPAPAYAQPRQPARPASPPVAQPMPAAPAQPQYQTVAYRPQPAAQPIAYHSQPQPVGFQSQPSFQRVGLVPQPQLIAAPMATVPMMQAPIGYGSTLQVHTTTSRRLTRGRARRLLRSVRPF